MHTIRRIRNHERTRFSRREKLFTDRSVRTRLYCIGVRLWCVGIGRQPGPGGRCRHSTPGDLFYNYYVPPVGPGSVGARIVSLPAAHAAAGRTHLHHLPAVDAARVSLQAPPALHDNTRRRPEDPDHCPLEMKELNDDETFFDSCRGGGCCWPLWGWTREAAAGHGTLKGRVAYRQSQTSPWHGGYYDVAWGMPVAVVVPPTAESQTHYGWGVGATRVTPIQHQFERAYPGPGAYNRVVVPSDAALAFEHRSVWRLLHPRPLVSRRDSCISARQRLQSQCWMFYHSVAN